VPSRVYGELRRDDGDDAARGRRYRALVEIMYAGGSLPPETYEQLTGAVRAVIEPHAIELSFSVSADPYSVLTVEAILAGGNPLEVISRLDHAVDQSLWTSGLFQEFDFSGRLLRIAPLELSRHNHRSTE
jgi:hypothetical protein